jgi:hypothetical protein
VIDHFSLYPTISKPLKSVDSMTNYKQLKKHVIIFMENSWAKNEDALIREDTLNEDSSLADWLSKRKYGNRERAFFFKISCCWNENALRENHLISYVFTRQKEPYLELLITLLIVNRFL